MTKLTGKVGISSLKYLFTYGLLVWTLRGKQLLRRWYGSPTPLHPRQISAPHGCFLEGR